LVFSYVAGFLILLTVKNKVLIDEILNVESFFMVIVLDEDED